MISTAEPHTENRRRPSAETTELRPVNPLADPEWDRLAGRHTEAGIFHTGAWARVLHSTYGHQPFYLACYQNGNMAALVPLMEVRSCLTGRRAVSVPFADFCGPLLFEGCERGRLMNSLTTLAAERRWRHVEFRGGERLQPQATPSVSFYAHTLDLTKGPERLFDGLESSVRRAVRKSENNKLVAEIRSDEEAVLTFYRLHCRTRRRHGLPPQPLEFFRSIHREIIGPGMGAVVLVSLEQTPVSAFIFLYWGRQAVYKFGACDERLQELRGNNLAMWTGLRYLTDRGCASLDLGRTSAGNAGLRHFKLGWGAAEIPLNYFRYNVRAAAWTRSRDNASGRHNAIFSRLPLSLNRLIGAALYPHLD
jgi:Acetyltransferase (GNAT) domain